MAKMLPDDFFAAYAPAAVELCKEYNLPASVLLAQAAIESGWGENAIGQFNLFGRKYNGSGPYIECWTLEQLPEDAYTPDETHIYIGDGWWNIYAKFQDYSSFEDAVKDWCELMYWGKYESITRQYQLDFDLETFVQGIAGIYATRETYADDILATIKANDLRQYDTEQA